MQRWIRRDPDEFDRWLETQKRDPWLNGVRAQAFRSRVARAHYRADWPKLMRDAKDLGPDVEDGLQTWILQCWRVVDPTAAEAWAAANADELSADYFERSRARPPQYDEIRAALAPPPGTPITG